MRERVAELTVNTNVFKEQVDFSKDTPHSVRIKHVLFYELVPLHYADTLEIMVLDNIKGQIIIGKMAHEVLEHDVVIVPPYYVHSTILQKSTGVMYNLKICFNNLKHFMDIQAMAKWAQKDMFQVLYAPELFDPMMAVIQRLIKEDDNLFSRMHCLLSVAEMLTKLNEDRSTKMSIDINELNMDDQLRLLIQWTHAHYKESISLDMAAAQMRVSKFHLCKQFKQATNMTYFTYLNQVRIDNAVQMLKVGKNVTECATECGFSSTSYFIHIFKRILGYTPGEFLHSLR